MNRSLGHGRGTLLALLATALSLLGLAVAARAAEEPGKWERPGENIALGKSYTLAPAPNYALCRDADDKSQLTDGQHTAGYFWTQPSTVGWQNVQQPRVVLDLGQVEPIAGLSYHCAAGRAQVTWPQALPIFVSDDGEAWWNAGDLVALSREKGEPPADTYTTWRFWTEKLGAKGRYVAVAIVAGGPYTFCDEIEVYRGDPALLDKPRAAKPAKGVDAAIVAGRFQGDIRSEAEGIRRRIEASAAPGQKKARLKEMLAGAVAGIPEVQGIGADGRALWPYGEPHRRLLAVQAALWRAEKRPALQAWTAIPCDPISPYDVAPPRAAARVDTAMMRNEVRSVAVNVTNAGETEQRLRVSFSGIAGAPRPAWIQVRQIAWTPYRGSGGDATPVGSARVCGSALPDLPDRGLDVPAGTTGQLWLTFDTAKTPAGDYRGQVVLTPGMGKPLTVPLRVRVSALAMPDELSLALGGWDYTDGPGRGITEANLESTVAFLRSYHVNAPWATGGVMPFGKHDGTGKMTEPPDTKRLDAWIDRWPKARYYCVYNAFGKPVADTAEDRRRVAEWIAFYVEHLKERGIEPTQLLLLLVDETRTVEQDERIVSYARVIREAAPGVVVFNDPIWKDPREATAPMLETSGMLCPNRVAWAEQRKEFEAVYLAQRDAGRTLGLYSCSGPVRALDPYSYHRLQAWDAFRYGAVWEGFWAFGDNGNGSAWNEYTTPGVCFSPQFLDAAGNTTSKHMEAVREGLYDYEYLVMLRDAVAKAGKAGRKDAAVLQAKELLKTLPAQVVDAEGAGAIEWLSPKRRDLADQGRLAVLAAIKALGP